MALLAAVTELVSTAFGQVEAKPSALPSVPASEVGANAVAAPAAATVQKAAAVKAAKVQNFSMSPLELRIMAYAPRLRVIATGEADSRQMASLADANERQLLFVKITLG
jgi:hypothetical protein